MSKCRLSVVVGLLLLALSMSALRIRTLSRLCKGGLDSDEGEDEIGGTSGSGKVVRAEVMESGRSRKGRIDSSCWWDLTTILGMGTKK